MADDPDILARLEKLGPDQVRQLLAGGGWPLANQVTVTNWLAEKDREQESEAKIASLEAERASAVADRQATAVERADSKATIALIFATIAMAIAMYDRLRALIH